MAKTKGVQSEWNNFRQRNLYNVSTWQIDFKKNQNIWMFHCFIANYDNVRVISTGWRNFWWNTQLERLSFLYFWRCFEHLFENVFHLLPNCNIFALIFQFSNVFQLFLIFDNCSAISTIATTLMFLFFVQRVVIFLCYYHTCADQLIINCHTCDIWFLTGIIHPVTFCSTFFPFLFFFAFLTLSFALKFIMRSGCLS